MNTEISSACKCYGLYDDDVIIGFMGILHQPHAVNDKLKRVSRLVILPDYQGIGLGYKFLMIVAKSYSDRGYDFSIVTSAKNLIMKLNESKYWKLRKVGVNKCSSVKSAIDYKRSTIRDKCKTASFQFVASGNARIPNDKRNVE